MKVLMHICCAPCSVKCINILKEKNHDITGYWYNPNIHPYTEYKNRLECLKEYSKKINLEVIYNDKYGIADFTKNVVNSLDNRCGYCYISRLEETAKYAKNNDYEAFTTTLLISPYQNHELIIKICDELSKKYDVKFLYEDFRPHFRDGQRIAREEGLYMQKFCGCIYSEAERYLKKKVTEI